MRERWSGILHGVIERTDFDTTPRKVTIISDDSLFSTYPRGPSERDLRRMLSRVRRAAQRELRGVPYLLQADFVVRRQTVGYRIAIEVHWHGLVWASAKQIDALKRRLPANRFGAARFHARAVYDLGGALRYVTKDTRFGYRTAKNFGFRRGSRNEKEWFQFREAIYGPQRRLLLAMTGSLTKPELCAASGAGLTVLRKAKRLAKDRGYGRSLDPSRRKPGRRRSQSR
jgi:hypothetical protein